MTNKETFQSCLHHDTCDEHIVTCTEEADRSSMALDVRGTKNLGGSKALAKGGKWEATHKGPGVAPPSAIAQRRAGCGFVCHHPLSFVGGW